MKSARSPIAARLAANQERPMMLSARLDKLFNRNGCVISKTSQTFGAGRKAVVYTIEEEFATRRYIAFDPSLAYIPVGALIEFFAHDSNKTPVLRGIRYPDGELAFARRRPASSQQRAAA
jgi:hypothetical protein